MRLLFQKPNQSEYHHQHPQGGKANKDQRNNNNNNVDGTGSQNNNKCMPVSFDIKNGRKYLIYVKKVSTGRYVAVATPDLYTRKSRKVARKLLCKNCGKKIEKICEMYPTLKQAQTEEKLTGNALLVVNSVKMTLPLFDDLSHINIGTVLLYSPCYNTCEIRSRRKKWVRWIFFCEIESHP